MATPQKPSQIARTLLGKAFPPSSADKIFTEKVLHRPLSLHPTNEASPLTTPDARTLRQQSRQRRTLLRASKNKRKTPKPKPLSAKEIRTLGVYKMPAQARKYAIYEPLHQMWIGYMQELIAGQVPVTPAVVAKFVSAEFVGAQLEVVRCRCVSRVGIKGIVLKDSKFVFDIITRSDEIKHVPKEHAVFRFEIPPPERPGEGTAQARKLVFELHGSQFEHRSTDRANKKFKQHNLDDL
ncbi:MAG: hypothetical protein M1840_000682 [Geoglossum simile]|nr:MAG: hypothetical protein M1840_000682 [Geoglossum simile]